MLIDQPRPRRFLRSASDERLVALVRAGDAAAFEVVYDRYAAGLLSFCRHMLGSLEEAEDAVQHTFVSAHRALGADRREIHLRAWLYAIARNRCLSLLRARREELELDEERAAAVSTAGLAAEVERREELRELLGDMAQLPDDQRAALVLSELGAHSHEEIAEVLGVRRAKVKALVFQARESLAGARTAREIPCPEIREELATAAGGALRRGHLRRHLQACPGCRAFRDEVARQRAAFAILLPVVPSLALRHAVLAATAKAGMGAGMGSGAGALAGAGAKGVVGKLLAAVLVAGAAGGGGYAVVHAVDHSHHRARVASAHSAAVRGRVDAVLPEGAAVAGHAGSGSRRAVGARDRAAPALRPVADRTAPAHRRRHRRHHRRHHAATDLAAPTVPATEPGRDHPAHPAHPEHPAHPDHPGQNDQGQNDQGQNDQGSGDSTQTVETAPPPHSAHPDTPGPGQGDGGNQGTAGQGGDQGNGHGDSVGRDVPGLLPAGPHGIGSGG